MKINFTKKEYETLLEITYIAHWIINAFDTEPVPEKQKYDDLEQKILSFAKEFGMDNLVVRDLKLGKYFHTREFEEGRPMELIEEFENESFWHELSYRLAERDFEGRHSVEEIENMGVIDRIHEIDEIAYRYLEEFEKNGLRNIRITKK